MIDTIVNVLVLVSIVISFISLHFYTKEVRALRWRQDQLRDELTSIRHELYDMAIRNDLAIRCDVTQKEND